MKNVHLLPTDKPSRLFIDIDDNKLKITVPIGGEHMMNQNIYISSEEEIKEDDYRYNIQRGYFKKVEKDGVEYYNRRSDVFKKIILTTDQDLINDGVQPIDDTFLEWFIKNPSYEEVKIESWQTKGEWDLDYKIIIPKEEPKQETLEEAALRLYPKYSSDPYNPTEDVLEEERNIFIAGGRYQSEKMYSETEVLQLLLKLQQTESYDNLYDWFEQVKKK